MDRLEKTNDPTTSLLAALAGNQTGIWTAMPGIIQSFNPSKLTVTIQPAIQSSLERKDGTWEWVDLPLLVDCPVIFPNGGGFILTYPLVPGDECLVIFASRCIDNWWLSGGVQRQAEIRLHDLSDGFCMPGPISQPNIPGGISTSAVQMRTKDGTASVSLNTATKAVTVTTPGAATINAANINLNGVLTINGQPYVGHQHSGVTPGGSNTGGVA